MKITIEISDELMAQAQHRARGRGVTVDDLVAEGLRVIVQADHGRQGFTLRDASFMGEGLQPEFERSWDRLRDAASRETGA
jgi:hypothetical protein